MKHEKDGRAHVYAPLVERQEATRSEIRRLVTRFFGNSHELLVLNILKDQSVDASELKRLRKSSKGASDPMGFAAHWQVLAQIFAERMLNGVGEGIVLAVFAWALLRISGRQNSSTRFAVWFSMMVAISALPFFGSIGLSGASLPSATHSAFQLPGSYAADIFFGMGSHRICRLNQDWF